jgi:hypothetical protein
MNAILLGIGGAAMQQNSETIRLPFRRPLWVEQPPWPAPVSDSAALAAPTSPMSTPVNRLLMIKGITLEGATFRPSDWSERLAGAMSCFRPDGVKGGIGAFIGYSPLCVPRTVGNTKCVIVSEALRAVEPMAWDFVTNFARDNRLQVLEVDAEGRARDPA